MWRHNGIGVGVIFLLALASGCSKSDRVYKVQGKVSFDGKPMVGGGSISFVPLGDQSGKNAGGEIAADGSYSLTTHKPGDGSMTGEFRVVIIQATDREPDRTQDGEKAGTSIKTVAEAERIPAIYGDTYKSPLRAKVEAKDLNEINFTLDRSPAQAAILHPLRDLFLHDRFARAEPIRVGPAHIEPLR